MYFNLLCIVIKEEETTKANKNECISDAAIVRNEINQKLIGNFIKNGLFNLSLRMKNGKSVVMNLCSIMTFEI